MSGRQRLYLSLAILCFATCRPYQHHGTGYPLAGFPCKGGGSDDKQAPIACVNADTLAVRPEPLRFHDHQEGNSNAPVVVQWFTSSGGGDLKIVMKDDGCVMDIRCPNPGHCRGRSNVAGAGKTCRYSIMLDGRVNDPTVIVDGCCM